MQTDIHKLHGQFIDQCRYAARLRPATIRCYEQTFRLFVALTPGISLGSLTPATLVDFFRKLQDRVRFVGPREVRRGVRASTIASHRGKLGAFFGWLESRGIIESNPLAQVPAPAVEYEDRKYLNQRQIERIFVSLTLEIPWKSPLIRKRNVAIFCTLLYCGVRAGELLGLRLLDVEFDKVQISVRSETSKSRRRRLVPLNTTALEALRDYVDERTRANRTDPALWLSGERDRPFTKDGLKHLVERVKGTSGVDFHLHQLRHTFAVNLLCAGSDISKLKQLLGHQDVRMTCAYLRCLPVSALREDVDRLRVDSLI